MSLDSPTPGQVARQCWTIPTPPSPSTITPPSNHRDFHKARGHVALAPTRSNSRHPQTQLPFDVLLEVFHLVRESATFLTSNAPLFSRTDGVISVGPPIRLTEVCRFWHEVAFSSPLLWSTIPILVESGRLLTLANPGQVNYYLERLAKAPRIPLTLIMGTRRQLLGTGVKSQEPLERHSLNFVATIASRVRNLAIAFELYGRIASVLPHRFYNLESVVFLGTSPSHMQLQTARFWQSPYLRKIVWAVSETAPTPPPLLSSPWTSLTEVIFADDCDTVLPTPLVHAFFRASQELMKFQAHVREMPQGYPGEDVAIHQPLPVVTHLKLQTLILTFRGKLREHHHAPELLCALRLPRLRHFSFKMDWSAGFNPGTVTRWLCTDSHRRLTRFECLTVYLDTSDLIRALHAMPALEAFKSYGGVVGETQRLMRVQLVRDRRWVIDDHFLHSLSTAIASTVPTIATSPSQPDVGETMPCPLLREIYIVNGYFSGHGVEAFLRSRIYGEASSPQPGETSLDSHLKARLTVPTNKGSRGQLHCEGSRL